MSLGTVPYVKLSEACDKLEDARRQLRAGSDPVAESNKKKRGPTAHAPLAGDTLETVAREWFAKHSPAWTPGLGDQIVRRLELNLFP